MDVTSPSDQAPDVHPPVYRSFLHAAKKIYRAEGMRGFYAGFTPCMLRAFPANAVSVHPGTRHVIFDCWSYLRLFRALASHFCPDE